MDTSITSLNRLPTVIDGLGIYIMRDGRRAHIHTIKDNSDKSVTSFTCKGSRSRMFRGKQVFDGYAIWHESGRSVATSISPFDIVAKEEV